MTRPSLCIVLVFSVLSGSIQRARCQKPAPSKEEKAKSHWPEIERIAKLQDYAGAAKLAVAELEGDYPDRQYAMWKWWETTFGDRNDYLELSRRFGECLFDIYEHSSPTRRRVIAEIFGRPGFDVSRSAADFRLEIEKKK